MFRVIEGIEKCGKSTATQRAVKYVRESFGACAHMHYPYRTTPIGGIIDGWLHGRVDLVGDRVTDLDKAYCLQGLFLANKLEVQGALARHLATGHAVAERYTPSGVAYGTADGLPEEWLVETNRGLLQPDLTVLLDIPPEVSFERVPDGREHYEQSYVRLERARQSYLRQAKHDHGRWLTIDGTLKPHDISLRIADAMNRLFEESV